MTPSPISLKMWLSKKHKQRRKMQRKWRKLRRHLTYACASYRRPYTRPAIGDDQRRVQLAISRRASRVPSLPPSGVDVVAVGA
jgi:hypothetical protein